MKTWSNLEKRKLVYYRTIDPKRYGFVASKLNRNESAIAQKASKMKATGEWDQVLNDIMQDGWQPKGATKLAEPQMVLDFTETLQTNHPTTIDLYDVQDEESNSIDYPSVALGFVVGLCVSISIYAIVI
jgi:hypothetical protein